MTQAVYPGGRAQGPARDEQASPGGRNRLGAADRRLCACAELLSRQVVLGPARLLDDETVARVQALIDSLANQLTAPHHALVGPVREMLAENPVILTLCHALAVEWRMTTTLAARQGIDPLLPPLIRHRLDAEAEPGSGHPSLILSLLEAQTRSYEGLRRMTLPLADLPADLHKLALLIRDAAQADQDQVVPVVMPSPNALANDGAGGMNVDVNIGFNTDVNAGRMALLHRFVGSLGDDLALALQVEQAGAAVFFTGLAIASGHSREAVILAIAEDDPIRLALLLRAAGLPRDEAARQLLTLRPDADPDLADAAQSGIAAQALLGTAYCHGAQA